METSKNKIIYELYNTFKVRKLEFIRKIKNIDQQILEKFYWEDIKIENILSKKNWYTGFVPSNWLYNGKDMGVYYSLRCAFNRKFAYPKLRLYVNVESPIKAEYKDKFKQDVLILLKEKQVNFAGISVYPNAGKKLIEILVEMHDENSCNELIAKYKELAEFNKIVALVLERFRLNNFLI